MIKHSWEQHCEIKWVGLTLKRHPFKDSSAPISPLNHYIIISPNPFMHPTCREIHNACTSQTGSHLAALAGRKKNRLDGAFEFQVSPGLGFFFFLEMCCVVTGKYTYWVSPKSKAPLRLIFLSACSNSCLAKIHRRQNSIVPSIHIL